MLLTVELSSSSKVKIFFSGIFACYSFIVVIINKRNYSKGNWPVGNL